MKEDKSYFIEVETRRIVATLRLLKEALVRSIKAIKKVTRWNNPLNAINIKIFLSSNKDLEDEDAIVKEERTKSSEEDVAKLFNKKRLHKIREST